MKAFLVISVLVFIVSCKQGNDKAGEELIEILKENDVALTEPQPGEWLFNHEERGQTFEQYLDCYPIIPDETRNCIYIQPIGDFDSIKLQLIQSTVEYLEIFYCLKVKILKNLENDIIPQEMTRPGFGETDQLFAPYILDSILIKMIPEDAIVLMALTERDIYHDPTWNYVFGLASLKNRVGVTSMYRFIDNNSQSIDYKKSLTRLIKVASHEIGHMFTLRHCINAKCTMNGSNSIEENDRKPNRFCSECTAKLQWNLKFKLVKRLKEIRNYFNKHGLIPDRDLIQKDIDLFD